MSRIGSAAGSAAMMASFGEATGTGTCTAYRSLLFVLPQQTYQLVAAGTHRRTGRAREGTWLAGD